MLTKANSGKYLTKEFHDKYALAVRDRNLVTAEELVWLGLAADFGNGKENPLTFQIYQQPVDTSTEETRKIDYRQRPECGD